MNIKNGVREIELKEKEEWGMIARVMVAMYWMRVRKKWKWT